MFQKKYTYKFFDVDGDELLPPVYNKYKSFGSFETGLDSWFNEYDWISWRGDMGANNTSGCMVCSPPEDEAAEASVNIPANTATGYDSVEFWIKLPEPNILMDDDASAIAYDDGSWKWTSFYHWVDRTSTEWQKVVVPLSKMTSNGDSTPSTDGTGDPFDPTKAGTMRWRLYNQSARNWYLDEFRFVDTSTYSSRVATLSSQPVLDKLEFTSKINGGLGECTFKLDQTVENFMQTDFALDFYRIEVYVSDEDSASTGDLVWSGIFQEYKFKIGEFVEIWLTFASYTFLLAKTIARVTTTTISDGDTGDRRFKYTADDPALIIRDLLDQFAELQPDTITYTTSTIPTTGLSMTLTINAMTFLDAINEVMKFMPDLYFWRLGADNNVYVGLTNLSSVDHLVMIGQSVVSGEYTYSARGITNFIDYHGGETDGVNLYENYTDSTSITAFGNREEIIDNSNVTLSDSAEFETDRIFDKQASPVRVVSVNIIDSNYADKGYDIESINVGDTIQVKSPKLETELSGWGYDSAIGVPFQVQSVSYTPTKATVVASNKEITQSETIETIRKKQQVQSTLKSPDTPT
jgi:hypothetical protein